MSDDNDRDANQALVELDKGLRSGGKGEGDQVECVISLSKVFDKHPFPIFINSACLKLSDCFNVSNNFVRLCIVRVLEESQKHLDKIHNVDEFIARIFQVVHSNDPVARAVTIRCLAACAPILAKRKNVHHAVLEALNSNDEIEVQASIHAVLEFSKVSQTFNKGSLDAIAHKIQIASVPMKLQLIPTLQYMDASQAMTLKAKAICENLLDNYVAHDVVITSLTTLTRLCCRSLSGIPQQLEQLFSWLNGDHRLSVQLCALENLRLLVRTSPHQLTSDHIQLMLRYASNTCDVKCKLEVFRILVAAVGPVTFHCFIPGGDYSVLASLIDLYCFDLDLEVSGCCLLLCSKLLLNLPAAEEFAKWSEPVVTAIQSLVLTAASQSLLKPLKDSLICMKLLADRVDNTHFLDVLLTVLSSTADNECCMAICEAFMVLELPPHIVFHDLINVLKEWHGKGSSQLVVMLCSVILHTSMSEVSMGESTLSTLYQVCQNQDYWCMFRVARQALRYGQYQLALRLLETLNHQVTSNGAIYFISCLKWFVSSQISLQSPSDESGELSISELDIAILSLTKAIRSIEAASKFSSQFNFHSTYLNLLLSDLETHRRAQCVCNMYWSCPPPAIGKIEGARTGDDLIRYGRLTEELRKCSADFHLLYSRYSSLQETLLDADTETHRHVKMLMERIFLMTQLVDSLLSGEKQFSDSITQEADENSAFLNSIKREWPNVTSFSDSHEVVISLQQIRALKAASYRLLTEQRLPLPRYFFQKLQTTTATINVRPHQKPGESVLMHAQSYLTLTVEGIISYSSSDHQKKVKKVSVELQSRVQQSGSASHGAADVLGKESPKTETNLQNTVKVVNEYFCTDFLLAFPLPGIHSVKIACKVIDCNDIHWDIGCTADITVKSYKEKKHSSLMKSST